MKMEYADYELYFEIGKRRKTIRGQLHELRAILRTVAILHPKARFVGGHVYDAGTSP
jgi:hypothetical protein